MDSARGAAESEEVESVYDETEDTNDEGGRTTENVIQVNRAAKKCYRDQGKKERQAALFPELMKTIEEKRKELRRGDQFPDRASRRTPEFREALKDAVSGKIGGSPRAQERFFEKVLWKYTECFWIDGCAPPLITDKRIRFRLNPPSLSPGSPFRSRRVTACVPSTTSRKMWYRGS